MNGIGTINIELTSRCGKNCHMCGRTKMIKKDPAWEKTLGDMDFNTFKIIVGQIYQGTVVQLHWNGEPTLYQKLHAAIMGLRHRYIYACMDTNGLLVGDRWSELLNMNSITVSVIQGDSVENYEKQIKQMSKFVKMVSPHPTPPKLNIRALGKIPVYFEAFAEQHGIDIITRVFHAPEMSRNYKKKVTKPEIGVCLDLLHHPAIDRRGDVYPCVRFNPDGINCLGNVRESRLDKIFGNDYRKWMIEKHFSGKRSEVPICDECDYWGVPRGE